MLFVLFLLLTILGAGDISASALPAVSGPVLGGRDGYGWEGSSILSWKGERACLRVDSIYVSGLIALDII